MSWPSRPRQRFTTVACDSFWHHSSHNTEFLLGLALQPLQAIDYVLR
jgi:hypothetical protein